MQKTWRWKKGQNRPTLIDDGKIQSPGNGKGEATCKELVAGKGEGMPLQTSHKYATLGNGSEENNQLIELPRVHDTAEPMEKSLNTNAPIFRPKRKISWLLLTNHAKKYHLRLMRIRLRTGIYGDKLAEKEIEEGERKLWSEQIEEDMEEGERGKGKEDEQVQNFSDDDNIVNIQKEADDIGGRR
ncbi:hypothetical protein HAX54_042338 [Datura stramonium]|uniref:Uncharacterized protein n=1 Tax=Datura stramonium TaxID=4076 RepID=A0ABS8SLU6_DATST|nr:hypothetical protein [Datura stramonium]